MQRKLKGFKSLWMVAAIAVVLTIAGCSVNSPLTPDNDQNDLNRSMRVLDTGTSGDQEISVIVEKSETIAAETGGTIDINNQFYVHKFEVKPEALDENTEITVKYSKDTIDGNEVAVFEFGPSGLVFKESSEIQYKIADLDPKARLGKLYYFDPSVNDWVYQGYSRPESGVVKFDIDHFSKYAISD